MTKKWLMYAVTGILCCGLIGFAVAKQTNASGKTALERAKAALSNPTMSATNTAGNDNITVTDLNALVRKADASNGVSSSAQAPEGWVAPAVQGTSVAENAYPNKDRIAAALEALEAGRQLDPSDKALLEEYWNAQTLPMERNPLDAQGGPDGFGYRWVDNQGGDTATYAWEADDATWTELTAINNSDDAAAQITWANAFTLYGTAFTSAWVSSNGVIHFPSSYTGWTNYCTWSHFGATGIALYPLADDLNTSTGGSSDAGTVRYKDFGDRVVVTYDSVGRCCTPGAATYDFQAIMYPATGKVKYQYRAIDGTNPSATIGIQQGSTATSFHLEYLCNTVEDAAQGALEGYAVWFYPGVGNAHDFRATSVVSPAPLRVSPSTVMNIVGRFTNFGSTTESSPVKYQFNGGAIQTANTAALAQFGFEDVDWAGTETAPATVGDYPLVIWSDLANDADRTNDTVRVTVEVRICVDATINAPGSQSGNTVGAGDDCTFRTGEDYNIEVVIPNDGQWTFSLCGGSTWDTYLYLSTACCSGLLTAVDDFCGLQSEIQCYTLTAGTYYVDVEQFSTTGGDFTLNVTECIPCVLECQPTDIVEPDDFTDYCANNGATDPNGGNNVTPPAFTDIACGDWVCAQAFTCDATGFRDTDWFRFTITQTQDVTVTVESAFNNLLFGIVDLTGNFFVASDVLTDCNAGQLSVTACLPAGTYAALGLYSNFNGLPVPSTYRLNVECTTPSCTYGRCCYNGGSSCAVTTDIDCAGLGGVFDAGLDCTSPCENLCATDCGPNDGLEGDESAYCGSTGTIDPNGGCNVDPVSYQDIACGDTVCGEAFTCDDIGYRDTDWYRFTVDIPAAVTVSVKPEFTNMLFGIVDITDCAGAFFITNAFVSDCQVWSSVVANLNPGSYVAFAAPGVFAGQPYGGPSNTYRLAVNGICALEPCDPITDLAINVETAGAPPLADHIKLFWTAPQTDDYKVWSTTNPLNDGNPDDGADVDFALEATLLGVAAGPATWDAPAGFFGLPLIGAPKFYVVTAVCTPFQEPTGRCCYEGLCADVTEEECTQLGGTWGQFLTCANNPCPLLGGETINDAIVISALPYEANSNTCGMANDYDETCPYAGSLSGDQVFSYTPAANETINLSLCLGTTDYDTKLYIYENAATPGAPYACNDDLCTAPNYPSSFVSSLSAIALTGGNTYYIVVDGYGSDCGNYTLSVTN